MSGFTRLVVGAALIAGIVHVFRKDLQKVAKVLQKPAKNFVKEVKKELDTNAAQKAVGSIGATGSSEASAVAAEKARVAAAAAQEIAHKPTASSAAEAAPAEKPADKSEAPPLR